MNSGANPVLNDLNIFCAKEQPGQRSFFPNAVERISKCDRLVDMNFIKELLERVDVLNAELVCLFISSGVSRFNMFIVF
jgi:hypothetical protein